MDTNDSMELRDLPVDTRNYTIVDNITGKPIDDSKYKLTIDPAVIKRLNELKKLNEEIIRNATLKGEYKDATLVSTFTPEDNSVFTPVYEGEYIHPEDFNTAPVEEEKVEEEVKVEEPTFNPTEVIQQDGLLDRVVARDPSTIPHEEPSNEENAENNENNEISENVGETYENYESAPVQDNSTFTPEMAGLKEASEQIVKIDADKLGPAIKPPKESHKGTGKINLDVMEIREAKSFAWLAYLLFFIPLLINRKNRFVRCHANEGLELNIIEILGGILLLPYFLMTDLTGGMATATFVMALIGFVLLGMCALTIIPMMICAMCGLQFQIPWLWRRRIIKVSETRE